jgi:hypothetical protein
MPQRLCVPAISGQADATWPQPWPRCELPPQDPASIHSRAAETLCGFGRGSSKKEEIIPAEPSEGQAY